MLPASLRTRLRTPTGPAASYRYGYGVRVDSIGTHPIELHGGDLPGYTAATLHANDDGLSVAVLANRGGVDAEAFAQEVARVLLGVPPAPPEIERPVDSATAARVIGRYRVALPGAAADVAIEPAVDGLALRIAEGRPVPLRFLGPREEAGAIMLVFGAAFDPGFRLRLRLRDGVIIDGVVHQRGGRFAVERRP